MFINRKNSLIKILYITLCYVFINAYFIHIKTENITHHCDDPVCCSICQTIHAINSDCQTPITPDEVKTDIFSLNTEELSVNSRYNINQKAQTLVSAKVKKTE